MQPPHGQAPVYLHQIVTTMQTGFGSRPRPIKEGSEEMQPIPVLVTILTSPDDDGRVTRLVLPCSEWALHLYQAQKRDEETNRVVQAEQKSKFVLCCVLPPGYLIVNENDRDEVFAIETTEAIAAMVEGREPGMIPELAGLDPAIFVNNPDAVNRAMKEIFAKGKTNQGAEG